MSSPARATFSLREMLDQARLFQHHVGRRMWIVFTLTLAASLSEGIGIVMLLPLFQALGVNGATAGSEMTGAISGRLDRVLTTLGATSVPAVLGLIAAAFVLKALVVFAAQAYAGRLGADLLRNLQTRLFDAYSEMDYLYYCRRDTGHFINIIAGQTSGFVSAFGGFIGLWGGIISTGSYFALALAMAWQFGVMALVIGVVLLMLFKRLNVYVRTLSRKAVTEASHLTKLFIQFLQAFKYIAATDQVGHLRGTVMASIRRLASYAEGQSRATAVTASVREPLAIGCIVVIVLVQVSVLRQPLAPIMVSILLFYRGLNAMLAIQGRWQGYLGSIGSVEAVRDEFAAQARHREVAGSREMGDLVTSIEFRDVSFAYDAGIGDVLHQVSFTIPARSTVALVGSSGAGKSTVIDLLCLLLRPRSGAVLIDGVPGAEIKPSSWRRRIGFVSQDTVVFNDSLANNICLWRGDTASDATLLERVQEAAAKAQLAEFIESLPGGYQTQVGDRGIRLSGGQRQRLFIARELFKHPGVLILDEATSALDSESERAIQQSIEALKGRVTVVIIAHRLSTIRNVDRVFVFDRGRLVEQGSYDDLRDREDSRFSAMVALQSL